MNRVQTVIFVLGMHRSGTSAMAGALQTLGLELGGNLIAGNRYNPQGYFEHREAVNISNDLLAAMYTTWDNIVPLPKNWEEAPNMEPFAKRMRAFLLQHFEATDTLGIKDPRLGITLPLWQRVLDELGIIHKYIVLLRHPTEICQSMAFRDQMSKEKVLMMWMNIMLTIEQVTQNHPTVWVEFEDLLTSPLTEVRRISQLIDITFSLPEDQHQAQLDEFLNPSLKHYAALQTDISSNSIPWVEALWQCLLGLKSPSKRSTTINQIQAINVDFSHYMDFFYSKELKEILQNDHIRAAKLAHAQRLQREAEAEALALQGAFSTRLGWWLTAPFRWGYDVLLGKKER